MIKKVLVANRGEIALRVIRACRELGIESVAVHSEGDENSLHRTFADEDICIGPAPSRESYLNIPSVLAAAQVSGADAIHPGYGFLAENASFARKCQEMGITFIGPTPEQIDELGDKDRARQVMSEAGVPITPGTGILSSAEEAKSAAMDIGYPVLIKAVAGGGGKGMRAVESESEIEAAFSTAKAEAESNFGNGALYMEKLILRPRHIEIQILGDHHGNVIHLGERDCSIQRRHQKLIEESPSLVVDADLRERMGAAAVKGAQSVGYRNAGTMEFLLAPDGQFYFMEINTRIQVEHPVTEEVTGINLIKEQIRVARGEKLRFKQTDIQPRGHAIECRINAEDPRRKFAPFPGTITHLHAPGGFGVRVDSHIYADYTVPPHYDSMIAKLIVWGDSREDALQRMRRCLREYVIEGIRTTIPFHMMMMENPEFLSGEVYTKFVDELDLAKLLEDT